MVGFLFASLITECRRLHRFRSVFFFSFDLSRFYFSLLFSSLSIVLLTQLNSLTQTSLECTLWSKPRPPHKIHATEIVFCERKKKNYCWLPYWRVNIPESTNIFAFKLRFNFNFDYVCLTHTCFGRIIRQPFFNTFVTCPTDRVHFILSGRWTLDTEALRTRDAMLMVGHNSEYYSDFVHSVGFHSLLNRNSFQINFLPGKSWRRNLNHKSLAFNQTWLVCGWRLTNFYTCSHRTQHAWRLDVDTHCAVVVHSDPQK